VASTSTGLPVLLDWTMEQKTGTFQIAALQPNSEVPDPFP